MKRQWGSRRDTSDPALILTGDTDRKIENIIFAIKDTALH